MAYISDEMLNTIRAKVNIVDLIGKYVPLTQKGKNYFGVCPFHDDHSPSMSVSQDKQIYKCFSCGASGNVFTFVQNYENVPWNEAVAIVASSVGISIDVSAAKSKANTVFKTELEIMNLAEMYFQNNLQSSYGMQALKYLKERGMSEEAIAEFGIGLSLDKKDGLKDLLAKKNYNIETLWDLGLVNKEGTDVFSRRITFPLWDKDGNVVGFTGRIYQGENTSKYLNSKESKIFKKGELLYNYHNAKDVAKREKSIIVVEGNMDAIRLFVSGVKNVVALMGTSLTSYQIDLLKKLRVKVILCLDNDSAGISAMLANGALLQKNKVDTSVIMLSGCKDPDEYILKNGKEAFINLLKEPIKYFEFQIKMAKEGKDLTKPLDLANYINQVIAILKDVEDPILKDITIKQMASNYDIDVDLLKERVNFEENNKIAPIGNNKNGKEYAKRDFKDEIAKKMLYYMMNDGKFIDIYKKKLGFIDSVDLRGLANEILYYYDTYKQINIADFISYMGDKKLNSVLDEIIRLNMEDELLESAMDEYVNSYYRLMVKDQINGLKIKMKDEMDINKKMEIASRIAELKKGCVGNGRN